MRRLSVGLVTIGAALSSLAFAGRAEACGGFFCSQASPVNQAAERIIFSNNGDGTVTAVIQILYEGPSENFSWLLPISSVPASGEQIAVASDLAFTRLQIATNPQYSLTTRVEGTCADAGGFAVPGSSPNAGSAGPPTAESAGGGGVTVAASGVVGAFEWTVIALDEGLEDPADAAVSWLEKNGYDVAEGSRGLLRPYLEDGLYLLALRLTKGSDSGSIRPIALTYDADKPMIPIKLTAVAANEDMGVMTWLLGESRGVPENYYSLELNEAKINWFNANSNYNEVVSAAADEATGQGFVTEFAGKSDALAQVVWTASDESQWQKFSSKTYGSFSELFDESFQVYQGWNGFWDAVRAAVTLPDTVSFEDFKLCPSCYSNEIQFSPSAYLDALETNVIEPVKLVQNLIDAHPYVTRLYTTMSAAEMTTDPLFTFNAELEDVSNVHTAERIVECNKDISQFQAPWRIEFPQGVVRGEGFGTWPEATLDQPANIRILRLAETGSGAVVEDNTAMIGQAMGSGAAPASSAGAPSMGATSSTGGTSSVGAASSLGGASTSQQPAAGTPTSTGSGPDAAVGSASPEGDGCSVVSAGQRPRFAWLGAVVAFCAMAFRRRQRPS